MKRILTLQNSGINTIDMIDFYPVHAWMPSGAFPSYLRF